ncbi:MAG: alanine dehydrogenase [Verrucomicrobiae bacterium]|nr:alanine dehydrogenase [Verrucomicrobiae bacterium]
MRIGIPRERKRKEYRVACTPGGVRALVHDGHTVLVERGAGEGSGYTDDEYAAAGARVVSAAEEVWSADLIYKVKEPLPEEYPLLRPGLMVFTFLHLAANRQLTEAMLRARTTGIAYETIRVGNRLPLLEPMSEIAGRMSAVVGSYYLGEPFGGRGVLVSGVTGVLPARVVIIGGGTAGSHAARMAFGMGAEVVVLEVDVDKLRQIEAAMPGVRTLFSTAHNLEVLLPHTDLLISAVLVPGAKAPKLLSRQSLGQMPPGSVFVDISIDQGGSSETSRPTTHDDPIYVEQNVVHYCVTNMPGAYPRTASQALMHATLPYARALAAHGALAAAARLPELRGGINTWDGHLTCRPVAEAHGLTYEDLPAA